MQYLSNKLRLILLYAIIFNFISSPILARELVIEKELIPFLEEWKTLYKKACNKPIDQLVPPGLSLILLRPTKAGVLGVCYYSYGRGFEIHISPGLLVSPDWDNKMRTVVFHEFTHCMLNVKHTEDPNNYMFKYITEMDEETLNAQVLQNLREHCDYSNY